MSFKPPFKVSMLKQGSNSGNVVAGTLLALIDMFDVKVKTKSPRVCCELPSLHVVLILRSRGKVYARIYIRVEKLLYKSASRFVALDWETVRDSFNRYVPLTLHMYVHVDVL